jgi:MFS family permease
LAPSITAKLGIKASICLGASTYSAWIVVSLFPYSWVFMLSSMMLGLGAAVLWNQQSLYMTLTAQAAGTQFTGYLTGLFWTCFSVSSLIGNVISISVIASGASTTSLLWILAGIGCVSVLMFFFVPSPHTRPDGESAAVDVESATTEQPEVDTPPESISDRIKSLRACFSLPHVYDLL